MFAKMNVSAYHEGNMNIYDIANKAGVSIATVSRIINKKGNVSPKTEERVLKVIAEMGYTPNAFARALGLDTIKMVGVLCSDVSDKHYAKAVSIIERELRAKEYDSILACTGNELEDKKKAIGVLLSKRVDALILVGSIFQEKKDNSHIKNAAEKLPVIIINGEYNFKNTYSVSCDEKDAVKQCVLELSRSGHRDILYMYDVESFSGLNKIAGFKEGIRESGLMLSPQNIIKCERTLEASKEAVISALERGLRFSAVLAGEDVLAVGAMKAFLQKGINVPGDVAVVGFNNSVLAECTTPSLTSIDNRIEDLSTCAVKTMLDVFESKPVKKMQVYKGLMAYRESFKEKL